MKFQKVLLIVVLTLLCMNFVYATEFKLIQGDSIFIQDVQWVKLDSSNYVAYVSVDLNYIGLTNPLNKHSGIVEQYKFNNWWTKSFSMSNLARQYPIFNADGELVEYSQLMYFVEIPTVEANNNNDDICYIGTYPHQTKTTCGQSVATTQVGYYGLPFYIKRIEFLCDIDDTGKGKFVYEPGLDVQERVNLIHNNYEGIPDSILNSTDAEVPMGFVTYPGDSVRHYQTQNCNDMSTTNNAGLNIMYVPNPLYRHVNPNIEGSEKWQYSDIITSLPSLQNSELLNYNLNMEFDYSGNYWNYTITENESDTLLNQLFPDLEMECDLESVGTSSTRGQITRKKYSELSNHEKSVINTGEEGCSGTVGFFGCSGTTSIITCFYPTSPGVTYINDIEGEEEQVKISFENQKNVAEQHIMIDKKLNLKEFIAKSIIPFFAVLIIFVFYIFSLIALGIVTIALLPLMFNQFIKGLKDAFDVSELTKGFKRK